MKGRGVLRKASVVGLMATLVVVTLWVPSASQPAWAQPMPFQIGDVFTTGCDGKINRYKNDGSFIETLVTPLGGCTTGLAFDAAGNLYVTHLTVDPPLPVLPGMVSKFDKNGVFLGTFGSGYIGGPESIVLDAAGNAYVGMVFGDNTIRKFDPAGNPVPLDAAGNPVPFDVMVERSGADWIDLAADQCTMFYTSEGSSIKRFNVCTNIQLPDFATNLVNTNFPGNGLFALRILPDGSVLVAATGTLAVLRVDASGSVRRYGEFVANEWFALALDSDGTSFWSGLSSGNFYKFDIASGNQLQMVNTLTGVFGLAVFGEVRIEVSGVLKSVEGAPISGATVTLLRSDTGAPGSFNAVPDGNGVMSPANQHNPDTTNALGQFGWDVIAGFYKVQGEKAGCTSSTDPLQPFVESAVLTIPPAVIDLDLRLACAAVKTPADLLAELIDRVDQINLEKKLEQRLIHDLDKALEKLSKGKGAHAVCKALDKFIKDVQKKKVQRHLTAPETADLLNGANEIKTALGCP